MAEGDGFCVLNITKERTEIYMHKRKFLICDRYLPRSPMIVKADKNGLIRKNAISQIGSSRTRLTDIAERRKLPGNER